MNTRYRIDTFQQTYFVIDDFNQLFDATAPDFTPIYARLAAQGEPVSAADTLETDKVYQRGTREGFASGGDN
jgi:phenylalanine-4-hydroxylase